MRATPNAQTGPVERDRHQRKLPPAGRSTPGADPHKNWTERRGPVKSETGGKLSAVSGDGWKIKSGRFTIRIMNSGGGRTSYYRVSMQDVGALDQAGIGSSDRALTHLDITDSSFEEIKKIMEEANQNYPRK